MSYIVRSGSTKISKKRGVGFSLPAGKHMSCPGATEMCKSCYAKKGRFVFPNVANAHMNNWKLVKKLLKQNTFSATILKSISPNIKLYRIHISGDFFSQRYLDAWAKVIKQRKNTRFWAYTRSFHLNFSSLTRFPNFSLWASTDKYNVNAAKKFVRRFRKSGVKHAYGPWEHDDPLPDNSFFCPAVTGKIIGLGACEKCMLCVIKKATTKNVIFPKH